MTVWLRLAPLAFVSGLCALAYQTAWLRMLRLVFGASTGASAATVAIFMAGLGIGSLLLGARADRSRRPLALYAQLETAIAVCAALSPLLVALASAAYVGVGGSAALGTVAGTALRLLLAALVLAPPTLAMGGTLPALAAELARNRDPGRLGIAWLYGWNTVGAVAGALLATFVLIDALGVQRTIWLGAALNLLVAVVARAIARQTAGDGAVAASQEAAGVSTGDGTTGDGTTGVGAVGASVAVDLPSPPAASAVAAAATADAASPAPAAVGSAAAAPRPAGSPQVRWLVLATAALVGFAFFLMELVWYRMLAPILGGSTYTFGLVLAVALSGIGLGGLIYALTARPTAPRLTLLGITCALEAVCLLLPYALGDRLAVLAMVLRRLGAAGFDGLVLGWVVVSAAVVLPAALVAGYQFPLLLALLAERDERAGRDVATAYAWNTAGGVLGAMAGGFGLMAAMGAPETWRAVGLGLALVGVLLVAAAAPRELRRAAPAVGLLVALAIWLAAASGPTAFWRHSAIGAGRAVDSFATPNELRDLEQRMRRVVVWEAEGIESSVALEASGGYSLLINGKSDGHARSDAPTQVMAGLIGAALHPDPQLALVIGLGTGSSAGWLAEVPSLRRVDVAELEPAVVVAAERCGPVAHDAVHHPKVRLLLGDGRELLQTSRERYDVIFSEPSNPYRAGVASLFSRELYRTARARLGPQGLFLQWLQAYEVDAATVRLALATLASEFPHVEVWRVHRGDLVLVGAAEPLVHDAARVAARMASEPWASALRVAWGVAGAEGLYAGYLAGPEVARALFEAAPRELNTDDHPRLETAFARQVGSRQVFDPSELRQLALGLAADRPRFAGDEPNWELVAEAREVRSAWLGADPDALAPEAMGVVGDRRARRLARAEFARGDLAAAWSLWQAQTVWSSDPLAAAAAEAIAQPGDLLLLAESAAEVGSPAAPVLADRLAASDPTSADLVRGRWRLRTGDSAGSAMDFAAALRAYRRDPWPLMAMVERALPLVREAARGDRGGAAALFAATAEPFAVHLFDQPRQALRLDLLRLAAIEAARCPEVYTAFEPHVPWDERFLAARRECYVATNHPLADAATGDLAAFRSQLPEHLADLVAPDDVR